MSRGPRKKTRPLVDIDMGIGRLHGYRDPARHAAIAAAMASWSPAPPADVPQVLWPSEQRVAGQRMQHERRSFGAARVDVATFLGVSQWVVQRWEQGRQPTPDDIAARWLSVCAQAGADRRRRLEANR